MPIFRRTLSRPVRRRFTSASSAESLMYCIQCGHASPEQDQSFQIGCRSASGICGKTPATSIMQDLLLYLNNGVSQYVHRLGQDKLDPVLKEALRQNLVTSYTATLTHANFDEEKILKYVEETIALRAPLQREFRQHFATQEFETAENAPATFELEDEVLRPARKFASLGSTLSAMRDEDSFYLRECAQYGAKGVVAYFAHAEDMRRQNGDLYSDEERDSIFGELFDISDALCDLDQPAQYYKQLNYQVGAVNLQAMGLLDRCQQQMFGRPTMTWVSRTPVPGRSLLVSGDAFLGLYNILEDIAANELNINVYTHGEMLPAHSYPEIKQFTQLKGHFGSSWQQQNHDFSHFPGPIVITSNCLMPPRSVYKNRLYTSHAVGYDFIQHLDLEDEQDRNSLLQHALQLPGFDAKTIKDKKWNQKKPALAGHGRDMFRSNLDMLAESIKDRYFEHVFLIGSCDAEYYESSYFGELAAVPPENTVVFTPDSDQLRRKTIELGVLKEDNMPMVIDMGLCRYWSAIKAFELVAGKIGCSVSDLPLHFSFSWFEQKSIAVFLSLLNLGVKNINIGPISPAFFTDDVKRFLFEQDK